MARAAGAHTIAMACAPTYRRRGQRNLSPHCAGTGLQLLSATTAEHSIQLNNIANVRTFVIRLVKALLLASLCACACIALHAQTAASEGSHGSNQDKLKLVVVLSRHGVRSPTWTVDRLNTYSSKPWPAWSVPPGYLTAHGFELMKLFGAYDRASLVSAGLFPPQGCSATSVTYIWADTDQRTLESGKALAAGLFPDCAVPVHSLSDGENDPLFHPQAPAIDSTEGDRVFAEFSTRAAALQASQYSGLLAQMNRVLLGCEPDADCSTARPPETPLMVGKNGAVRGKGDHIVTFQGPLAQASTFAEDFQLEYTEGMPSQSVGWGKVDEAQVVKFIALHSIYFDLMHRTPSLARMEASGMLNAITRTLQQGVEGNAVAGAIGAPGNKLVLLVGHDTNIGPISALLGLHWNLDGRADDIAPGTELAFELWQTPQGAYRVNVTVTMQTLRQMREAQVLTPANPPARQVITLPACGETNACSWDEFRKAADAATGGK
jgi:4-phytase/acid phosphatase